MRLPLHRCASGGASPPRVSGALAWRAAAPRRAAHSGRRPQRGDTLRACQSPAAQLAVLRDLYARPRDATRFRAYLDAMLQGTGDVVLPITAVW